MATVSIGDTQYTLSDAIKVLTQEIVNLQTKNGELSLQYNTTQRRMDDLVNMSKTGLEVISTIPPFKGTLGENINHYFKKIDQACTIGKCSASQKLNIAKQRLEGNAFDFALNDPDCKVAANYTDFKKAMLARYKPKTTARNYRMILQNLSKREDETIDEFADRIRAINSKTYDLTGSDETDKIVQYEADQRALDTFLKCIEGDIGVKLRLSMPKTLTEATVSASNIEQALKTDFVPKTADKQPQVFATSIVRCNQCRRTNHTTQNCRKCTLCGKFGHTNLNCRSNQPPQQNVTRPFQQNYTQSYNPNYNPNPNSFRPEGYGQRPKYHSNFYQNQSMQGRTQNPFIQGRYPQRYISRPNSYSYRPNEYTRGLSYRGQRGHYNSYNRSNENYRYNSDQNTDRQNDQIRLPAEQNTQTPNTVGAQQTTGSSSR